MNNKKQYPNNVNKFLIDINPVTLIEKHPITWFIDINFNALLLWLKKKIL